MDETKKIVNKSSLVDIADAIRFKNHTTNTYKPSAMGAAIRNLPGDNYQTKTVTENGDVTADAGYDALAKVTVNVSGGGGKLQEKTSIENEVVTPDEGYDGLSKVTVQQTYTTKNVTLTSAGKTEITPDYVLGCVMAMSKVTVNAPIYDGAYFTTNGVKTAASNYLGFNNITVQVQLEPYDKLAVTFLDYNGDFIEQRSFFYIGSDFPEHPVHDGLTSDGWSCTWAEVKEAKTYGQPLFVSAVYQPTNNVTTILVVVDLPNTTVDLGIGNWDTEYSHSWRIDWGDGVSTLSGGTWHKYTNPSVTQGSAMPSYYTIKVYGDFDMNLDSPYVTKIMFAKCEGNPIRFHIANAPALDELIISNGVKCCGITNAYKLDFVAFPRDCSLMYDTPKSEIDADAKLFRLLNCYSLKYVVLGHGNMCEALGQGPLSFGYNLPCLRAITFPDGFGVCGMVNCYRLSFVWLPRDWDQALINFGQNVQAFTNCYSLRTLKFPSTATEFWASTIYGCINMEVLDFLNVAGVAALDTPITATGNYSQNISVVHSSSYDYANADNWKDSTGWTDFTSGSHPREPSA